MLLLSMLMKMETSIYVDENGNIGKVTSATNISELTNDVGFISDNDIVNTVTSGNMNPVTSNAVSNALSNQSKNFIPLVTYRINKYYPNLTEDELKTILVQYVHENIFIAVRILSNDGSGGTWLVDSVTEYAMFQEISFYYSVERRYRYSNGVWTNLSLQ